MRGVECVFACKTQARSERGASGCKTLACLVACLVLQAGCALTRGAIYQYSKRKSTAVSRAQRRDDQPRRPRLARRAQAGGHREAASVTEGAGAAHQGDLGRVSSGKSGRRRANLRGDASYIISGSRPGGAAAAPPGKKRRGPLFIAVAVST